MKISTMIKRDRRCRLHTFLLLGILLLPSAAWAQGNQRVAPLSLEAIAMYDSVRAHFHTDDPSLLLEQYPRQSKDNPYSFLWGYSAMLSAVAAIYESTGDSQWLRQMDKVVLRGADLYRDRKRKPVAYASYITRDSLCDRFYDDNIWLGIDMVDLYICSGRKTYLKRSEEIWRFVMSGYDDQLGGGIYWNEQEKKGKNTCSNAPAAVYALKLYLATKKATYLEMGERLYLWTKAQFEDPEDHLYWDNQSLNGHIGRAKFSYNSGQMVQAAALLYRLTGKTAYLEDARQTAESCYLRFFTDRGGRRELEGGELWFDAVMLRGLIELYQVDGNETYVRACMDTAVGALDAMEAQVGACHLVAKHYRPYSPGHPTSLLNQAALIEIMARLSMLNL